MFWSPALVKLPNSPQQIYALSRHLPSCITPPTPCDGRVRPSLHLSLGDSRTPAHRQRFMGFHCYRRKTSPRTNY
ncbi:hypothetical protein L873DRAFT_1010748 [Choiromyces venosus 120613-1]|uniref:Uncharacterized protein n=1 Tax=Choiromyces venosus 120613-1 TaxID=1336337 RepID=A0A3N4JRI1_9PEZI|nr:hypothetical protein L873DRAFT_1010748 [Choiromyces venosus 120613-1]